ncbi:MAG: ABC transporter permease [Candidatus Abawacabacteria bacterium]|nr:ABC transporter permease [Candidatus Abawacabacteria bacterium]
MLQSLNWISLVTITQKEVVRFLRIWPQTILPPLINQSLYFIIFGTFIGSQIPPVNGVPYMAFLVPGLVMMGVINSAYSNVVSSFFGAKFQKNIEELLVSPTPSWVIIAGFTLGGMLRGFLVGIVVFALSMFFVAPQIYSLAIILLFIVCTALVFALGGLLNAIFATKFDDISIFTTFILTPLTYLGGVFYSVKSLPALWQTLSYFNPILYLIDGFRYGFYGQADISPWVSIAVLLTMTIILLGANIYLFKKGIGLKQ